MAKWQDYSGFLSFHSAARGIPLIGVASMPCHAMSIYFKNMSDRISWLNRSSSVKPRKLHVSLPVALRIRLRKYRDSHFMSLLYAIHCNPLYHAASLLIATLANAGIFWPMGTNVLSPNCDGEVFKFWWLILRQHRTLKEVSLADMSPWRQFRI